MAYSIRCRDGGVDCPGEFTTETENELVKHAQMHLTEAHAGKSMTPEQIKSMIKVAAA